MVLNLYGRDHDHSIFKLQNNNSESEPGGTFDRSSNISARAHRERLSSCHLTMVLKDGYLDGLNIFDALSHPCIMLGHVALL